MLYLTIFSIVINKGRITNIAYPLYFIFDVIPFAYAMKIYREKRQIRFEAILDMGTFVGVTQAVTAIMAFLVPSIQELFITLMISYGYSSSSFESLSSFRLYGFSPYLTFGTPVIQSVLAVFILFFKEKKGIKDYVCVAVIFFSAIINARISIIIILVGFFTLIISRKVSFRRKIVDCLLYFIVLFCVVRIGTIFLKEYSPLTYEWIIRGINEIEVAIGSGNADKYSYITYFTDKNTYRLPDNAWGIIFGEGITVMTGTNAFNMNSDVGYINDIWLGGVLYVVLVYSLFIRMITKIMRNCVPKYSQIGLFFLLLFPILNIKGITFTMFSLSNYLMILYINIRNNDG
ncbi:hypothetical protein B5F37_01680 [Drancourtella sp. An210]|nr:hypothetical protein B5F37_01680 [Drancourtella sp. An210]